MKEEEWRPVPGFEGFYSVSDLGRIRRDARIVQPALKRFRYLGYTISKPGQSESHWVHTLVAAVFLGSRPSGHHIHHKNGDRQDNSADNLVYLPAEVHQRLPKFTHRGSRNGRAKLTEEQVRDIRALPRREVRYDTLAAQYGVSPSTMRALRNTARKEWQEVESATPMPTLTAEAVRAIRAADGGFGRIAALATQYGVSTETIWRIRARRTWKHLQ